MEPFVVPESVKDARLTDPAKIEADLKESDHAREQQIAVAADEIERQKMKAHRRDVARRKLQKRFGELTDPDLIVAAKAAGQACLAQWGAFCVNKRKMNEFTGVHPISLIQAAWLLELIDQTTAKAAAVRENLKSTAGDVDWTDDQVADAVGRLTWDDLDRAGEENGVGWSKADSSKGHWRAGMIKMGGADRSIGIHAARAIVGKYSGQIGRRKESA